MADPPEAATGLKRIHPTSRICQTGTVACVGRNTGAALAQPRPNGKEQGVRGRAAKAWPFVASVLPGCLFRTCRPAALLAAATLALMHFSRIPLVLRRTARRGRLGALPRLHAHRRVRKIFCFTGKRVAARLRGLGCCTGGARAGSKGWTGKHRARISCCCTCACLFGKSCARSQGSLALLEMVRTVRLAVLCLLICPAQRASKHANRSQASLSPLAPPRGAGRPKDPCSAPARSTPAPPRTPTPAGDTLYVCKQLWLAAARAFPPQRGPNRGLQKGLEYCHWVHARRAAPTC